MLTSHIGDQQSMMFYKRVLQSSDVILSTLLCSKQSDICALRVKYGIHVIPCHSLLMCSETIYGTAMSVK